ncbi:MAG: S41 family peptidase [Vampirovibrionales bacterium]|nr:S41 family peptidase [Vampirovibrionales bacterium]
MLAAAGFACLSLSACSLFFNQPAGRSIESAADKKALQAERVYHDAWQMLLEEYVDGSFNGQDWYRWKDHYKGRLKDEEDAYVAIQTMTASLNDIYTRFLKPRDMQEQTISIDSKLSGIGIQISMKDSKLVVVSIFEDTPAYKAGLMPKDIITKIDEHETSGMDVEDAADQIRGPKGSLVKLTLLRGDQTLVKNIARAEIKIHSVFTMPLDEADIGYIRLSSFISESEMAEMLDVVQKIKNKKALILDLRGNYGGLLSNAIEVADMFLEKGAIVQIVDRASKTQSFDAASGVLLPQPLVVLVDGGSASASEIVSGALKDHKRATLIGTQTFGKGLVQKIVPLYDGSGLNITISKYLTPNGTDINKKGIEPNIKVAYTQKDFFSGKDPQLEKAISFLKERYRI